MIKTSCSFCFCDVSIDTDALRAISISATAVVEHDDDICFFWACPECGEQDSIMNI